MKKNSKPIHQPLDLSRANLDRHNATGTLDDEQRIKVLSPSMLVFKRFIRNKLAIVGLAIIVAMFLFSFLGAAVSPYGEFQVFETEDTLSKDYAGATMNTDYRYTLDEGATFPGTAWAQAVLAIREERTTFESGDNSYGITKVGNDCYVLEGNAPICTVKVVGRLYTYEDTLADDVKAAFETAYVQGKDSFTLGATTYYISAEGRKQVISVPKQIGYVSKLVIDRATKDIKLSFAMEYAAQKAVANDQTAFEAEGKKYTATKQENGDWSVFDENGKAVANLTPFMVNAISGDVFLSPAYKAAARAAIESNQSEFTVGDGKDAVKYTITRKDFNYVIRSVVTTKLVNTYASPSSSHWLGTDEHGMDVMTRLMYGGRISLIIGFVVVFLETFLGIVLGGISGYFGGWIDNIIMRVVDVFNCIPTWPLLIIMGSILDANKINPQARIYYLMVILGVLGWPGIARMVRGQILSLREQEFMTATEAIGLSTSRRIFRHLVPNVIPQLIVMATMGLGGIILTESTMSFLGIGVKFPYASWGNIISAVSTVYVMTNYWFVWIPAGFLILITVLGFNFIGDGLRDAFDPKMKR